MRHLVALAVVVALAWLAAPAFAAQAPPNTGQGLGTAASTPAAPKNPNVINGGTPGQASPQSGVTPGQGKNTADSTSNTAGGGTSNKP